jgi:uncharacterized protein YdhG (YjbR/CyaY superfamily)
MTTAKNIADRLFEKMKAMQRFDVEQPVEKNWLPRGVVPFNVKVKDGIATFEVYAMSLDEAVQLVEAYVESDKDE